MYEKLYDTSRQERSSLHPRNVERSFYIPCFIPPNIRCCWFCVDPPPIRRRSNIKPTLVQRLVSAGMRLRIKIRKRSAVKGLLTGYHTIIFNLDIIRSELHCAFPNSDIIDIDNLCVLGVAKNENKFFISSFFLFVRRHMGGRGYTLLYGLAKLY